MTVPPRSPEQRQAALAAAQEVRFEKARVRAALHAGELSGVDVLEGAVSNRIWAGFKVVWLLESLPGIGPVRAARMMTTLAIAQSRRIHGLGVRQRAALAAELGATRPVRARRGPRR